MQGYLVGNPVTGDDIDRNSQIPYAHSHGIISDQQYEVALLFIQIFLPTWTTSVACLFFFFAFICQRLRWQTAKATT
jgi:hypothetical protein